MTEDRKKSVFRQKRMERVSSPEQLNNYLRVTTPSVWLVLLALVILLAGILAWSIFGRVEIHNDDGSTTAVAPITYVTN